MAVRGEKAAARRQQILDAARDLMDTHSADFTLANIAAAAGTSVQTVLRAFGNKEGLIVEAVVGSPASLPTAQLAPQPASVREAVSEVFDDYEDIGDRVIWVLAQEHRIDGLQEVAEQGRQHHRAWVDDAFAEHLTRLRGAERRRVALALAAATDVYVWKLLRRDLGLDRTGAEAIVERLVRGVVNHQGV